MGSKRKIVEYNALKHGGERQRERETEIVGIVQRDPQKERDARTRTGR